MSEYKVMNLDKCSPEVRKKLQEMGEYYRCDPEDLLEKFYRAYKKEKQLIVKIQSSES